MKTFGTHIRSLLGVAIILSASFLFSACTAGGKSGLQVLSSDIPSSVYLDGKFMEKTPYINKELKPAEYSLEIRPDDTSFVPYQTNISLKGGMLAVVNWKPGKRPETSGGVIFETEPLRDKKATELLITTIPDGGIIYVDGEAKGFAPVTVQNLPKGEHQFEVKLPSYGSQLHPINVLEGYRIIVTAKLGKQDYQAAPTDQPASPSTVVSPSASPSASPRVTLPSPSPKTATLPAPKITVNKTGFIQDGKEVLRVRSQPSSSGVELGFAPVGSEYIYLKESRDGWVKIQFGTQEGWVSRQFVTVIE
jgi:hypothetical protein